MENLYQPQVYNAVVCRINKLNPNQQPLWGKMNVAQMLAHVAAIFTVPLATEPLPRPLLGRCFGWMVKFMLYNDAPFKKGLPTGKNFKVNTLKNFEEEKENVLQCCQTFFTKGPSQTGLFPHPLFGRFTAAQWGKSMYKHVDHHLRQFGV